MNLICCNSTNGRFRTAWFLLIAGSIGLLPTGRAQQLCAQSSRKVSSLAQPPAKWDRYAPKDGEFSVLLPTVPAMNTSRFIPWDQYLNGRRQLRTQIGSYSQGVVYVVEVFEVRQSLDEFIAESRRASNSDRPRELTISGIRGKEFTFEDDALRGVTQYFLRGKRIYVFRAGGSRLGSPDVGIPRFLESIKFDRASVGLVIEDGPGVQESNDSTPVSDSKDVVVFSGKEVATKARLFTKPEPTYTEEARQKEITGTVVLRGVFTSYGAVANLQVVSGLPHGLTEKSVAAARQIKFIPAIKDGRFVSMYIQLEYNFNLY